MFWKKWYNQGGSRKTRKLDRAAPAPSSSVALAMLTYLADAKSSRERNCGLHVKLSMVLLSIKWV